MSHPNKCCFSILSFDIAILWVEPKPLANDLWTISDSINKLNTKAANVIKNKLHLFYLGIVPASLVVGTPAWDAAMQQAAVALLIGNGFLHGTVSNIVLLVVKYLTPRLGRQLMVPSSYIKIRGS